MMFGRLAEAAGSDVVCVTSTVAVPPRTTEPPSAKTLSADASPLMTTSFTSAFRPEALAAAKTPYVGLTGADASFPIRTANIPSPTVPVAGTEIKSCVSETRGSVVSVPRRTSRLPAEIVREAALVLSNWIVATIRLSFEGKFVARESSRPMVVGTATEAPSLNADLGTEVSTSSSVSQSPAGIVVPVVESAYQQALSPALRVTLLRDVV